VVKDLDELIQRGQAEGKSQSGGPKEQLESECGRNVGQRDKGVSGLTRTSGFDQEINVVEVTSLTCRYSCLLLYEFACSHTCTMQLPWQPPAQSGERRRRATDNAWRSRRRHTFLPEASSESSILGQLLSVRSTSNPPPRQRRTTGRADYRTLQAMRHSPARSAPGGGCGQPTHGKRCPAMRS
jgi:hypothetical protein